MGSDELNNRRLRRRRAMEAEYMTKRSRGSVRFILDRVRLLDREQVKSTH